jgi:hypothetical protein
MGQRMLMKKCFLSTQHPSCSPLHDTNVQQNGFSPFGRGRGLLLCGGVEQGSFVKKGPCCMIQMLSRIVEGRMRKGFPFQFHFSTKT